MGKLLRLTMALATVGWAHGSFAACNSSSVAVSISASPVAIPDWNPLSTSDAPSTAFTITLTRASGNPNTDYALINLIDANTATPIRVGNNGSFAGPQYSIKSSSVDIAFASGATPANTLSFDFASGSSQSQALKTATFAVTANTQNADFTSGSYTESIGYTVQCRKLSGQTDQGTYTTLSGLNLSVTVPNRLTVVTAGPQTVNFGSFTTTSQNLAISLKSTGAINAAISSANGNKMVLAGAVAPPNTPTNSLIAYTMTFDSQTVPSGGTTLTNLARSGVGGSSKSLVLTLPGLPTGKLAGTYSDTITITLTAGS